MIKQSREDSMFKIISVLILTIILLSGCRTPALTWSKAGSTQDEFNRDKYQCVQEARVSWGAGASGDFAALWIMGAKNQAEKESYNLFKMCMEARGWSGKEINEDDAKKRNEQDEQKVREYKKQVKEKAQRLEEEAKKAKQLLNEQREKYQINVSSTSIKGNDVVTDNNNYIMWADIEVSMMDYDNTKKYVAELEYAGFSNWRLPTDKEMSYANLSYDKFRNIKNNYYRTSTESDEYFVTCFDMDKGYALGLLKTYDKVYVLPVRDIK